MFIDTGNGTGWTPVNDSTKDVAALDSFTIDWGSDGIDEQPEPAVMSFTLRDRAGRLAGQALTLAGMKVVVQFSNQPRWMDLTPAMGCWRDLRIPIDSLHKMYSPDSPDSPDSPSNHPSQLDLLHRLTVGPRLPQWHEVYDGAASTIRPLFLADPIAVHLSTDGRLNVLTDGETRYALSAADIEASTDLSITEPLTQVVINAKRVKSDNGKLSFDDVEITMGDQDRLPPQLTVMQKSLTVDSDMLAVDDSGGVWNSGGTSNVSATDRANIAQWLESHDLRMVPETVTFNSTRIDPARRPWLYKASPSGPFIIVKAKSSALTGSDGRPSFTGPITTIGGTLSYRWRSGKPTLTQEATLAALRPLLTERITWADLPTLSWQQLDLHICDLSMIQIIDTSSPTAEKEGIQ